MWKSIKNKFYINNSEGNKELNKQLLIIFISICATVMCTIGVSMAAFIWSDTSEKEQNLVVGDLSLTISSTSSTLGTGLDVPKTDSEASSLTPYTFTIKNNGTLAASYTLKIVDDTSAITSDGCSSNQIGKSYIGIKVDGGTSLTGLLSNYGTIDTGTLLPGKSKTYNVRLWIKSNAPNSVIGKHYHGKILLETSQTEGGEQYVDSSGANMPELATGMIPVTYDETKDVWVKANTSKEWYNYDKQMWANAVTVTDCMNKGDINQDGYITQEDANLITEYWKGNTNGYTEAEMISRGDIDGNGTVNGNDANLIIMSINSSINPKYNLCNPKSPQVHNREYYMNAAPGTEINMNDINTMWVWIPRYKYKIPSNIGSSSNVDSPPEIDVVFENGTSTTGVTESVYRNGITSSGTNTNYYTHPAFRDGSTVYNTVPYDIGGWDKELTGMWVGKFETSTDTGICNKTPTLENCENVNPTIKPDVTSLRNQSVSTQFITSLKLAGGTMDSTTGKVTFTRNTTYGLTSSTDTHMMKNTEWGAVAILSQSKYGKMGNSDYTGTNKEVYINNSSNYYTGRSGGGPGGSTPINGTYTDQTSTTQHNSYGYYTYNDYLLNYNTNTKGSKVKGKGTGASTTGSIYGIYDMSGGAFEYTMGNWNGTTGSSGFTIFPESKYYDKYTKGDGSNPTITKEKAILGDAIWETMHWYQDTASFLITDSFASHGGSYSATANSGAFCSYYNYGKALTNGSFLFVLIP